jgi:hypothetical protein
MFSGGFLAASYNDQYSSGYAFRAWAAEWWKALGHVPLWNPEIFGGMPFVAGSGVRPRERELGHGVARDG